MNFPETLASPGRKQASQHLQPGRVKLVLGGHVVTDDDDGYCSRRGSRRTLAICETTSAGTTLTCFDAATRTSALLLAARGAVSDSGL